MNFSNTYHYVIDSVNAESKTMVVTYTTEGKPPFTVHGIRLPRLDETLDAIIRSYAPVQFWIEQDTPVQSVEAGVAGVVDLAEEPEAPEAPAGA
jgi:hypothetical protein